jgi:hypothetical protein
VSETLVSATIGRVLKDAPFDTVLAGSMWRRDCIHIGF